MKNMCAAMATLLLVWGQPLLAQRLSIDAAVRTSDKCYVQATGEATIWAKPDQATIGIGVVTQGATAESAAAQNAKQTDAVLTVLRKILAGNGQLNTTSYSVRPNYQVPKAGAATTIASYTATNSVEVSLSELDTVGKVIDAVLGSGANTIQKLQFGLKDPQAARSQALRGASARAKASAEAIATGLGLHVVRVLSAEEYQDPEEFGLKKMPPPALPGAAPATPVEAGTIEVSATIVLRVEVAP
jgi:uncharacterized protein YggE